MAVIPFSILSIAKDTKKFGERDGIRQKDGFLKSLL
jgi:hypothetical protein